MANPAGSPPPRGEEARSAVEDVLKDQAERAHRRQQATPAPPRDRTAQQWLASAVLVGMAVWVYVAPPSVVRPPPPPVVSAPLQDAELRLTVYQVVLRLQAYQQETGAFPSRLDQVLDAPEDREGMEYVLLSPGRFRLTGVRGESVVLFETGDAVEDLLGNARRTLEEVRS